MPAPKHVVEGPEAPDYLKGYPKQVWLRENSPHLYFHEEVRLAKAHLSATKRQWGARLVDRTLAANDRLIYAQYELDFYHRRNPDE